MAARKKQECTILIADDVDSVRRVVRKQLEKLGFSKFLECRNGVEALEHLGKERVDLVISDWNMPDMPGIELLNSMRQDSTLKDTPFIMITSTAEREQIVRAAQQGVTDYMIKPFSSETLALKVLPLLEIEA